MKNSLSTPSNMTLTTMCIALASLTLFGSLMTVTAQARMFDRNMMRNYFECPICNPFQCPLPSNFREDCELVLEPGICACCQVRC